MSERRAYESFPLRDGDVPVLLHRPRDARGVPVLLVHGASACHETFSIPAPEALARGGSRPRSLADFLALQGFEPWLLDWRGSARVLDALGPSGLAAARERLDLDRAAAEDVPAALRYMRRYRRPPFGAVGHCLGGGVLAQAVASGSVTPAEHGLARVVLLTLGLFYEPPLDSRLKAQDRVLERLLDGRGGVAAIDPREGGFEAWPEPLRRLFDQWPEALRPHPSGSPSPVHRLCDRLAFLYGRPYLERNLVPEVHGDERGEHAELPRQFGPIPLRLYVHGARNSRRGWAARFDGEDAHALVRAPGDGSAAAEGEGPTARERFDALARVTLVTGDRNPLWHRDSLDRMYEWLRRGAPRSRHRVRKVVLRGYGHQDLLWGREAPERVFPAIREGLRIEARAPEDGGGARAAGDQPSSSRRARASARSGLSSDSERLA